MWDGVGMDVEPDTREIQRVLADRRALIPTLLRRVVDDRARTKAAEQYAELVARIHSDGYRVDSFELPFLEDERAVGGSLIHRILGLVDVGADREIPMLYTSFLGSRGVGFLWSYGRGKRAIIVGSTGGGVAIGGADQVRPLGWEEFSRDLRLASRLADDVGIFSLEGCIRQGFLERLPDFAWAEPVALPADQAATIDRWRAIARAVLWITARPYLLLALFGLALALRRSRRRAPASAGAGTGQAAFGASAQFQRRRRRVTSAEPVGYDDVVG
jgi:hypothetical protein